MEGPREIVPGVYGLGSSMVNWYLVEQDGRLTVVDAGLPGFAKTLEFDLARIGQTTEDLDAVVLTHSDGDHTGLVPRLHEVGARVLVHERDDETLRTLNPLTAATGPQMMPAPLNAANPAARSSLAALEALEADVLLPGHGEPWREGVSAAVERARSLAPVS